METNNNKSNILMKRILLSSSNTLHTLNNDVMLNEMTHFLALLSWQTKTNTVVIQKNGSNEE